MDQLDLFGEQRAAQFPSEHPLVILRWIEVGTDGLGGKVEAHWPEFQMTSWFRNWREALPIVLHELNAHVQVRVRP
jgi:hypothetical protein